MQHDTRTSCKELYFGMPLPLNPFLGLYVSKILKVCYVAVGF